MSKRPKGAPARQTAAPAKVTVPVSKSRAFVWPLLLLVVVATIGGAIALWPTPQGAVRGQNGEPDIVTRVESPYNDITVYREAGGNYLLSFGAKRLHYIESAINPNDELDLPIVYTHAMTAGLAYAANIDSAMIIGLGGGRTAWYHHKSVPTLDFTAVELDPEVVHLAGRYFGVHPEPNFTIANEDGRVWLARTDKTFDIILVDAYRGAFVPFHLLTTEFYKLVAAHLKPGGVAVQNVEPSTMLFDSAVATIKAAFAHVVFVRAAGNIVILAYNGPEKDEATLQKIAAERQTKYRFRYSLPEILTHRYQPTWNEKTAALTDDFAPVEYLKAIARHNEKQAE
ncbi:hypothetical protein BH10PSE9_BH10PSE9_11390 [soil metagenome]